MILRAISIAILTATLAGCAPLGVPQGSGEPPSAYPPDTFSHRVASSHVVLYWNCERPTPSVVRVDGVAQNPWYAQPIRFLEFELVGVNSQERTVSQARGEARDFLIRTNQISPFRLDLGTTGSEVRFDLFYQYRFQDTDMDALLAGPPVGGLHLFAQANQFLVRDVCSETQHRAR